MFKIFLLLSLAITLLGYEAFAGNSPDDFEGIVALDDCSGSLIRFTQSPETDPAMILTNGHCLENRMPPPGRAIVNQPSERGFDLMDSSGQVRMRLTASKVLYSTMSGTDITLYQTQETYAQITKASRIRLWI